MADPAATRDGDLAVAELIRETESLCPVCLQVVPAKLLGRGKEVILEGRCETHGSWQTLIWTGPPSFESWAGPDPTPPACHTCTAVMEITRNCDLRCPVCFAESSPGAEPADPPLGALEERLGRLFAAEGAVNLQLSGGEPTTRPDLPEVVAAACSAGFSFVQLNTNGIRISTEKGYAERLREAGLKSVFLQFDGLADGTYRTLRGRSLASVKIRAVQRCAEAGLAVVLVPTVVPGVNDDELGSLVRFAASWPGIVRGLHFQPISYFGRYPADGRPRLTLPEVLRALQEQTGGEIQAADFRPSCCEHPRCSFRARYWVREGGKLEVVRSEQSCCAPTSEEIPRRAVAATSRQWSRREERLGQARGFGEIGQLEESVKLDGASKTDQPGKTDSLDGLSRFLDDADRILAVSGMLFQDAWSIDMERVRRCCVKAVTGEGSLVSFCLWNVTSESGRGLHSR